MYLKGKRSVYRDKGVLKNYKLSVVMFAGRVKCDKLL